MENIDKAVVLDSTDIQLMLNDVLKNVAEVQGEMCLEVDEVIFDSTQGRIVCILQEKEELPF